MPVYFPVSRTGWGVFWFKQELKASGTSLVFGGWTHKDGFYIKSLESTCPCCNTDRPRVKGDLLTEGGGGAARITDNAEIWGLVWGLCMCFNLWSL